MKRISKTLIVLALILQTAYAQTSTNNELTSLKNALSQKTISSFVVLRMPDDIDFQIALTPQRLRELHPPTKKYTIEMNDSRATLLMDWIKQAKFTPRKYSPDCRWGFLFTDRTGKEVASLFSDKFGLAVNVDGKNLDLPDRHLLDTIHALVGPEVH